MATNKNIARLKKVQADAKKLKAKNPKLSHIEAVKKAWEMQPKAAGAKTKKTTTKKRKVGATMIIEKGESPKKRPTKVLQIKRSKKGTFEKFKTVGAYKPMFKAQQGQNQILWDFESTIELIAMGEKQLNDWQGLYNEKKKNPFAKITDFNLTLTQIRLEIKNRKKYISELKKHKAELKKLL